MSIRKNIPSTASVAFPGNGHRLIAPAAERNIGPILDLVIEFAPETGKALELASGTGQTSRVDALNQAIQKSKSFDLKSGSFETLIHLANEYCEYLK